MADYYSTLGLSKGANPDEIKRSYRKLASQYHPDKGGSKEKFQEIQEAYATLSDPEKRNQYDNPAPQGFPGGFHFQQGGGVPPGFEDIFSHFGGMFGGGNRQREQPRNRTLNMQTNITLEDAYNGKELIASVNLPSGREQVIEIKIPPGVHDGTVLRLAGMGDDSYQNIPRGDIHLSITVIPHHVFHRRGDDLVRTVGITCIDAMLGKKINIDTIDGRTLEVMIHPGAQPGHTLAAQGYGMPNINNSGFKGRMLMEINISIPTNLTNEQKDALTKMFI